MTPEEERRVTAAHEAWTEAEDTYHRESDKYVSVAWVGQPLKMPEKVHTLESLEELTALREAAQAAQDEFYRVLREVRPG